MKKTTIWILGTVMGISFLSLLYLQISYIEEMAEMRNEQFDEAVKRALLSVSKDVESEEVERWLREDITRLERQAYDEGVQSRQGTSANPVQQQYIAGADSTPRVLRPFSVSQPEVPRVSISRNHRSRSLPQMSRSMADLLKNRYVYQRALMDEVVWRMIYYASDRQLADRINYHNLDQYLRAGLVDNGINLSYHFKIVDVDGREIYRCSDYVDTGNKSLYTQPLFVNDPPNRMSTLQVHFPGKAGYIFDSVSFMIPSVIFTVVLLVTFVFTIYVIFRQKKLTEMKNDFINNMTHEFKTPISTISLAAQMLNDPSLSKSPSMFAHISGIINDETKRLRFQVEKVLQMSMFDRQKAILKMKEVDANELIYGVVNTFHLKVEKFNGKIEPDLMADNPFVFVDEMHITNVIFNLMDNAVKYRNPDIDLELKVSTWNEGDKLMIAIQDNGIGIKKEDLKKIFEKFYRVHTGNVHDVKGFGLGLAYVKKIIADHKGTIKAESEFGHGTRFIISLPVMKEV